MREAVLEHGDDVGRLADRFDVSRKAMQVRLRGLGLAAHRGDRRRPRQAR